MDYEESHARFTRNINTAPEYIAKAQALREQIIAAARAVKADYAENWLTLANMANFYNMSQDTITALFYEQDGHEKKGLYIPRDVIRGITPYQAQDITRAMAHTFGTETGEYLTADGSTWEPKPDGDDPPASFYGIHADTPEAAAALRFLLRTMYPDWNPIDISDTDSEEYAAFCNGWSTGSLLYWQHGTRSGYYIPLTEQPEL